MFNVEARFENKTEKLKYQKKIIERKKINKLLYKDPKKV